MPLPGVRRGVSPSGVQPAARPPVGRAEHPLLLRHGGPWRSRARAARRRLLAVRQGQLVRVRRAPLPLPRPLRRGRRPFSRPARPALRVCVTAPVPLLLQAPRCPARRTRGCSRAGRTTTLHRRPSSPRTTSSRRAAPPRGLARPVRGHGVSSHTPLICEQVLRRGATSDRGVGRACRLRLGPGPPEVGLRG